MAFFSDEETFANNQLVAGELDMKVDWEEHYSDWSDDEDDAAEGTLDIQMDVADASGYTAFPPGVEADDDSDPLLYVSNDDVGQFMDNTAIDAFPDSDDDGVQDEFNPENACEVLADVGADSNGLDPDGARTDNGDTRLDEGGAAPLINLGDVKPGDFGEATLSFHICDNPGYVWLQGEPVTAAENGHTDPEANDDDEEGAASESYSINQAAGVDDVLNSNIELLDEVQTAWWYDDNCNNLTDGGEATGEGQAADVVIVMDVSGSMGGSALDNAKSGAQAMVSALGPNDQVALTSFSQDTDTPTDSSALDQGLTTDKSTLLGSNGAIENLSAGGGTNMEAGVERAHEELLSADTFSEYGESGNARSNARKIMVVLGDGSPNDGTGVTDPETNVDPSEEATNAKGDGIELFTIAYGSGGPVSLLDDMASDPQSNPEDKYAFESDSTDIVSDFEGIAGDVGTDGEEILFQGDLRTALTKLSSGNGIPLDGDTAEERGCFEPSPEGHCIGFSWWLPVNHANEIQGDSVTFDLGFYTEQCRHNDGSGMGNSA